MTTGNSSIHIAVYVYSKNIAADTFEKKTHCIIVFVSVDENGKPKQVKKWKPTNENEKKLEEYALRLKDLRQGIENEMKPYFDQFEGQE